MNKKNNENCTPKGVHTFSFYRAFGERFYLLEKLIQDNTRTRDYFVKQYNAGLLTVHEFVHKTRQLGDKFQEMKWELEKKYLFNQFQVENITTTVGRTVLAQLLAGTYTGGTGDVNYTAVGDNNTAAAVGQTTLVNETFRKAVSDTNTTSTSTLIETFFATSEAVDTHEEYGNFIDGTATVDTGTMFNRFVATTTKSATESMNVQSTVAFNDA